MGEGVMGTERTTALAVCAFLWGVFVGGVGYHFSLAPLDERVARLDDARSALDQAIGRLQSCAKIASPANQWCHDEIAVADAASEWALKIEKETR